MCAPNLSKAADERERDLARGGVDGGGKKKKTIAPAGVAGPGVHLCLDDNKDGDDDEAEEAPKKKKTTKKKGKGAASAPPPPDSDDDSVEELDPNGPLVDVPDCHCTLMGPGSGHKIREKCLARALAANPNWECPRCEDLRRRAAVGSGRTYPRPRRKRAGWSWRCYVLREDGVTIQGLRLERRTPAGTARTSRAASSRRPSSTRRSTRSRTS